MTAQDTLDLNRLLIETVREYAIFVLDATGHIMTWNPGAERMKGYRADEIIGQHFSIFYPREAKASKHPESELAVATREGRYEEEGWRVRKDGSQFWANVVITALRNESGELVGFAKITRDLTERRESQLRAIEDARRLAEAEAANRTKSQFLAMMSHELRTPLNAIGGYAELLALGVHGDVTEPQREAIERIRVAQKHLLVVINDILNFTRLESGRVTYNLAEVSLLQVAAEVRPLIEPQATDKGIEIRWPDPDEQVVAWADQQKVDQILLNLVGNAVKFTDPGGHVRVRAFTDGASAGLEVSDDGIGVPPDRIEAIFEPFVQLGRSNTSAHEGTGLGLAISRDLARAMSGELTVRSRYDEGATFTLTLPRFEPGESSERGGRQEAKRVGPADQPAQP